MVRTKTSDKYSFELWSLKEYLKGRKRSIVTGVAALLLYVITDEALAAIIGGIVVEGLFSVADYYLSEVEVPEE